MFTPVILAIDEGTTNAKAVAVDAQGNILSKAAVALQIAHPEPGRAEQDAMAIWHAVCQAVEGCLSSLNRVQVAGIAISNQRESVLIWERRSGRPLTPLVSWQDRRSERFCQALQGGAEEKLIEARTGLPLDPLFPAAKIHSMLAELPDGVSRAAHGELCIGTVDCWLNWQLSGGQAYSTDYSNAARTQLFDIHRQCWDEDLLALFAIPSVCLPAVTLSAALHGHTALTEIKGLAAGIPIVALIGDSHAALYGQGINQSGAIKATYGTGSSLMTTIAGPHAHSSGLSTTIAWHDGELRYALEGNITHTGSGFAWIGKMLGIPSVAQLTELALSATSAQGVFFVPALSGLGAPHWDTHARGLLCGLTDATTPATIARAGLEAIAYQIADVFFAMEQAAQCTLPALRVDGGATQNRWLMQFQADLLQRPLIRNHNAEVSALGAAYLGGKTLGWWRDGEQIAALPREVEFIEPRAPHGALQESYAQWQTAVARARFTRSL
ncbi:MULTISPECIES: FGGY family carbohydrate kinase [unclassified Brenneria]|uniref:FGGY family carbohydrate kinase n=1 Tax=unclassified Brenneria TaxID=2634434 RepID=UPI001552DE3B|nr:FGGY-family carbohydrate kinase [Brenneria sp. hezel4-2-4]MEE3650400.1 FGGY-family carbohydrate kinase [Brenneria sp. HEZEL_4_2_4]NPD00356.1 FGGY-family carbohydrate kinase [Brenneria sp. hezel4-2-4]